MADIPPLSLDDLAKARDQAHENANEPGQDFDAWEEVADRLEVARQKLAGKLINDGGQVYLQNQALITQTTADLNAVIDDQKAVANALAAFDQVVASVETVAKLIA